MNVLCRITILSSAFLSLGCMTEPAKPIELLKIDEAQLKARSYQTRTFDVSDQGKVLRSVMASLQDLGFILERVNGPMGMVTAGKFARGGVMELTVVVRAKGRTQTEVRANVLLNTRPVEDPKAYQNFFAAVERSLFLAVADSDTEPTSNP